VSIRQVGAITPPCLRVDWHPRTVGQHDGVESNAEACLILQASTFVDQSHGAFSACTGRNHNLIADFDVARDPRFNRILDLRAIARDCRIDLQTDHRICRNGQLFVLLLRLGRRLPSLERG